ncbi:MAG: peptide chain release factor N(5)-glutamine methyltransferase [Coriobacteriia bacterium]|nr:peptide chain release factor N(5)-glutamine methyltransferase [Coriobacteriia bacterium]
MDATTQRDWTVLEALDWCTHYLEEHKDQNPRLSAQWLLSHVTDMSRVEVYAYHDRVLTQSERAQLREELRRRGNGEPLQYILGEAPFRDLMLKVTPEVLIPRPETEGLVDLVLARMGKMGGSVASGETVGSVSVVPSEMFGLDPLPQYGTIGTDPTVSGTDPTDTPTVSPDPLSILDIGTGSGAIALALAAECPATHVTATDISPGALALARENAERLGLSERVEFVESDCYDSLSDRRFDLIVSNPPYIPSAALPALEVQVRDFEPVEALDGGADGLDFFRRILSGSADHLRDNGALFVELDERNVTQACDLAVEWNIHSTVVTHKDLNGRDRYVEASGLRD